MAIASLSSQVTGYILAGIELNQINYTNLKCFVMPDLCCDVILGHYLLKYHSSNNLPFVGPKCTIPLFLKTSGHHISKEFSCSQTFI